MSCLEIFYNQIKGCCPSSHPEVSVESKRKCSGKKVAYGLGVLLLAGAAVAAGLFHRQIGSWYMKSALHNHVTTVGSWRMYIGTVAGMSLASLTVLGMAISYCISSYKKKKNTDVHISVKNISEAKKIISEVKDMEPSAEEYRESTKIPCHHIMGGVYLGDSESFAQTTGIPCAFADSSGIPQSIDVSNPQHFTTVITACPLTSIAGDYLELGEKGITDFEQSFKGRGITWIFVGKMATDNPTYWKSLVYDCTFLDTDLATRALGEKGMEKAEYDKILQQKSDKMTSTPVQEWFEPIFKEIDRGIFKGKKVLVHCQAGRSRSATILAAYLMNRCKVSRQQAISFLKSKRQCVDPKFIANLDEYGSALASAVEDI